LYTESVKVSMNDEASSPAIAEPLEAVIRRLETSHSAIASASASTKRCIHKGTTQSTTARYRSMLQITYSGLKRRLKIIVVRVDNTNPKFKALHEWNRGAARTTVGLPRYAIAPKYVTSGSSPRGSSHRAPRGVPVVPDVKMTTLPWRWGRGNAVGG